MMLLSNSFEGEGRGKKVEVKIKIKRAKNLVQKPLK